MNINDIASKKTIDKSVKYTPQNEQAQSNIRVNKLNTIKNKSLPRKQNTKLS